MQFSSEMENSGQHVEESVDLLDSWQTCRCSTIESGMSKLHAHSKPVITMFHPRFAVRKAVGDYVCIKRPHMTQQTVFVWREMLQHLRPRMDIV
jgi:hypothetical protein